MTATVFDAEVERLAGAVMDVAAGAAEAATLHTGPTHREQRQRLVSVS